MTSEEIIARQGEIEQRKAEIDAAIAPKKVPCHNDPLCENWWSATDGCI